MRELIEIEHSNPQSKDIIIVNWCLGNTCNYCCSYCPDDLHSGSTGWVSYENAIQFSTKLIEHYQIHGKKMEFLFSGGEPTMYPYFSKFISFLKDNGCYISVITNGSRTKAWWIKNFHILNKVVLTYHYEFANLEHVLELIELLNNKLKIHINFTMLPLKFNEIHEIVKVVSMRFPNISLSLKPLLLGFGDEMYPYEKEQINVMENFKTTSSQYFDDFPTRGAMNKVYSDNYKERYLATDFILKKENHWRDWYCNIGLELLYIHYNGDVYNGICRQGGKLTNVFNLGHFVLPSRAIKCAKDTCHCLTDIMISKFKYL